jgi:23S rRNA (guanosine2251-2'-O)-methyltransferase
VVQISLIDMMQPFEQFLDSLVISPKTSLVLLGGIQDPHNVGAIIRSAAAFGASAVLMPGAKQSPITQAVIKASAGMAFQLPLVSIASIPAVLPMLKKRGFKIYGLASGKETIIESAFASPSVFILGNEGIGLDKSIKSLCDEMLSIPMNPKSESLNVAAAAAVALYSWSVKHPEALA